MQEEQPVAELREESIGLYQLPRICLGDKFRDARPVYRRNRRRDLEECKVVRVLQLQDLRGELDVRHPAWAQLEIPTRVGSPGDPFLLHPRLQMPDLQ